MDDSMDANFPEDKAIGLDKILQSLDPIVVQFCGEEINNSESDLYGKVEAVLALLEGLSFEQQRLFPIFVQEAIFGENGQSDCRLISRRLGGMSGPLTVSHIILAACETSTLVNPDIPKTDDQLVQEWIDAPQDVQRIQAWVRHLTGLFKQACKSTDTTSWERMERMVRNLPIDHRKHLPLPLARALLTDDRTVFFTIRRPLPPTPQPPSLTSFLLKGFHEVKPEISPQVVKEEKRSLHRNFVQTFLGNAKHRFIRDLRIYADIYASAPKIYYGRTIAMVQLSGTGKSKLMKDLGLEIPSVTICFRNSNEPADGWPPRDELIQDFLLSPKSHFAPPEVRSAIFLGTLFEEVNNILNVCLSDDRKTLSQAVHSAFDHGDPLKPTHSRRYAACHRISERAWAKLTICPADILAVPGDDDAAVIWYQTLYMTYCHPHAESLAQRLNQRSMGMGKGTGNAKDSDTNRSEDEDEDESTLPPNFFVLGLDECSILNVRVPSGASQAHNVMSLFAVQRIIQAADAAPALDGGFNIWYTLLDTNTAIAEQVPLQLNEPLQPLPPWPLLGYDQMAPAQRSQSPSEANQVSRLRMFGRPIWSTVAETNLLGLATLKLFTRREMDASNLDHVLAAFTHRIGLEIAPSASRLVATSVRYHLRLVRGIYNRNILFTCAPSEPALALAACFALNADKDVYQRAVTTLVQDIIATKDNITFKGSRGQFLARLLLIIARDFATCRPTADAIYMQSYFLSGVSPKQVKTITLHKFLVQLLGPNLPPKILADTRDTHVNFTHFTFLETEIDGKVSSSWLRRAWERGVALQCHHRQSTIDLLIVTYSGPLDKTWEMDKLGTLCVQVKFKTTPASASLLNGLVGPAVNGKRPSKEVVILMDLGTNARHQNSRDNLSKIPHLFINESLVTRPLQGPGSHWPGDDVAMEKPRWVIAARGYVSTYPVMRHFPSISDALHSQLQLCHAKFEESYSEMDGPLNPLHEYEREDNDGVDP